MPPVRDNTALSRACLCAEFDSDFQRLQGIVIYRGAYFGLYDTASHIISAYPRTSTSMFAKWVLALLVTVTAGLASYPFDTVRRRMMVQARAPGLRFHLRPSFCCDSGLNALSLDTRVCAC